jgi:hypothetical protein
MTIGSEEGPIFMKHFGSAITLKIDVGAFRVVVGRVGTL